MDTMVMQNIIYFILTAIFSFFGIYFLTTRNVFNRVFMRALATTLVMLVLSLLLMITFSYTTVQTYKYYQNKTIGNYTGTVEVVEPQYGVNPFWAMGFIPVFIWTANTFYVIFMYVKHMFEEAAEVLEEL